MSFKKKLTVMIICCFALFLLPFAGEAMSRADGALSMTDTELGSYSVSKYGMTLTADKTSLNLVITKDGKSWYSGKRESENDGLNNVWAKKVTDAVTVGYRSVKTGNAAERAMTLCNSLVSFSETEDGFSADVSLRTVGINFTLNVKLTANGLSAEIPYESVKETSDSYLLAYIMIYPFFGSSYGVTDGYMVLPDGCGALVDLSERTDAKQPYIARVYGEDYGISAKRLSSSSPLTASFPCVTLVNADGGMQAVAESGAEYSEINAYASSITTDYNFACYKFVYRDEYVKYLGSSGSDGKNYVTLQEDKNEFDIKLHFTLFSEKIDYAQAAVTYGETLTDVDPAQFSATGLRTQFLMAENKDGMFGKTVQAMTTTNFAAAAAEETAKYCNNLTVSLLGYTRGGLTGSYPKIFPVEGKTGGKRGYEALSERLGEIGAKLSFSADFVKAYSTSSVSKYDKAMTLARQFITLGDIHAGSASEYNLLNPSYTALLLKNNVSEINKYNAAADLYSIGEYLFSGTKNETFDRKTLAEKYVSALKETTFEKNIVRPNRYLWSVADNYLDAPVTSSGYLLEKCSVPFLQIALSGRIPMYSSPLNLDYAGTKQILKLIDYGVYPCFLLTEQDAIELYGTDSSYIFTSAYSIWKDTVKEAYETVAKVLNKVTGCRVLDRQEISADVFVTLYENGKKVVVNYGAVPVSYDNVTVNAESAAVVG